MPRLIEYAEAGPEVRTVFDAIKAARGVPDVNNFWKALAVDPASAFQKLFTSGTPRAALMASKTARTSGPASAYSTSFGIRLRPATAGRAAARNVCRTG